MDEDKPWDQTVVGSTDMGMPIVMLYDGNVVDFFRRMNELIAYGVEFNTFITGHWWLVD